jgi:hypothetical protein
MVLNRINSRRRIPSSHRRERENVNQSGLPRSEVRDQMKQRTHTRQRCSLAKAVSLSVFSPDSEMLQITSTEIQISIILGPHSTLLLKSCAIFNLCIVSGVKNYIFKNTCCRCCNILTPSCN